MISDKVHEQRLQNAQVAGLRLVSYASGGADHPAASVHQCHAGHHDCHVLITGNPSHGIINKTSPFETSMFKRAVFLRY